MNIAKTVSTRLFLPLVFVSPVFLSAEAAPKPVNVEAGGVNFVIPAGGGPLKMVEGKRQQQVFSLNMRIVGENGLAAIMPDWKNTTVETVENTAERVVVRTESAMLIRQLNGKESERNWDAARFIVEYVFRRNVPGVVMVQRLRAVKPFAYRSWNVPLLKAFKRYSVDGGAFAPYPITKEFRSKEGGYRTRAGAYVQGETENGEVWWMGREFATFNPFGDGKPGGFYAAHPSASTEGRNIAAGEELKLSVSTGRVLAKGDVEKLRAFRKGGNALPVARFDGDWKNVPVAAWRGETKDYRPVAGLNWNGANDLSFSLKLAWDERHLYFHVDVTDDVIANTFSGKDIALGDSVHAVITDAKGGNAFDKVFSALDAQRRPGGYVAVFSVPWSELRGVSREKGVRFNLCVADQDRAASYDNWMGVEDGIMGGRDLTKCVALDFSGVAPDFQAERPKLPSHAEMLVKIEEIDRMNAALPSSTDDEYTSSLKAMTTYFTDFMRRDLETKDWLYISHRKRKIDDAYRYYMDDRVNKNADYLLKLQRELAERQKLLAAGKVKPIVTVKYPEGVRPKVEDGGFKVDGKELLLIGPDTWTNVKGWQRDDVRVIGETGFNQLDVFYIGGTNYLETVKMCEKYDLYCAHGSVTAEFTPTNPPAFDDMPVEKQNSHRGGMGHCMGSLVPSNPSPRFAYQIAFPEQWERKYEMTEGWAEEFRRHLRNKFGSLTALNTALGSAYASWTNINFNAALKDSALKYESFVFRMDRNLKAERYRQDWKRKRFGLPTSVHYSSHYNIASLDPLVVLADYEALWDLFDVTGFDGGFGLNDGEYAFDFAKGGIDIDFSRSFYPMKPVANNENHIISDGHYGEYSNELTYLSNILSYFLGMNAGSIWDWANTRHTYGEYAFTRANTYHATIQAALDLRRFPEEIAAFRRTPNPPFRILHSLPSFAERDPYVRSLYGLYGACSFTGWAVRFITERNLEKRDYKGTKVIVVPDARRVSAETFAALEDFVAKGGVVIVDGKHALTKDQWGKIVPGREKALRSFRRFADSASRTRFDDLNRVLAEKGIEPPVKISGADGKVPFGVIRRTGTTAAGEKVVFVANLNKHTVEVTVPKRSFFGKWRDILGGRTVHGKVELKSMEILLLK